jgi:hypothetical protein
MPDQESPEQVDWSEENLSKVISDIYARAATDPAYYNQLMAQPYDVLNQKIKVPDHYKGHVYAKPKNSGAFIMHLPVSPPPDAATGSSEIPPAEYQIICTSVPPW